MAIQIIEGNLFTTSCQTIVNTINCVGAMGAGIALECRLRYPKMFERYQTLCNSAHFKPGVLWLYKGGTDASDIDEKWILNFPTKVHWKYPSRMEWLSAGLQKFVTTYREKGITSIAFPVLGSLNGGLDPDEVIELMESKLSECELPIEIYKYRNDVSDDLYERFKEKFKAMPDSVLKKETGMRVNFITKIREALDCPDICQLNQLASVRGIGIDTMMKSFRFVCGSKRSLPLQEELGI